MTDVSDEEMAASLGSSYPPCGQVPATPGESQGKVVEVTGQRPLETSGKRPLEETAPDVGSVNPTSSGHLGMPQVNNGPGSHLGFQTVSRKKSKKDDNIQSKSSSNPSPNEHNDFLDQLNTTMRATIAKSPQKVLSKQPSAPQPIVQPPISSQPISAQNVMDRTLVIKLPRVQGTVYLREHFISALQEADMQLSQIEALGTLNKNTDWHITFAMDTSMEKVSRFCLQPFIVAGKRARVSPVSAGVSTVRVHWAPYFLPHAVITRELERAGEVLGCTFENSWTKGMEHVRTLVRTFQVACRPEQVPHIIHVFFEGQKYPLLLTIPGKPPPVLKVSADLPHPQRL